MAKSNPMANASNSGGLRRRSIDPADLLDAARTITLGDVNECDWLDAWIPATAFLDWARRGLEEAGDYGLSNAICYSKRAVACRIDLLVRYNHLAPFFRVAYPQKIQALGDIGIHIPDVVHKLVIDPRNVIEHGYGRPDEETAQNAFGVAEMSLAATEGESARASVVAMRWNAMVAHTRVTRGESVTTRGFGDWVMLFIDVFEQPSAAKIVDPSEAEVRYAELASFSPEEAVELARILRSNYTQGSISSRGRERAYYVKTKSQAGF